MSSERKIRVRELPSEFSADNERDLQSIDTIVIHTMYNPVSETPYDPLACKQVLDQYGVSSHYLIDRDGTIWQMIPENRQAWHAGISQMPLPDGRSSVNTFSIGIELIANEIDGPGEAQYHSLAILIGNIYTRMPITSIVGHNDIAPERKSDPWKFNWVKFKNKLRRLVNINRFKIIGPPASYDKR